MMQSLPTSEELSRSITPDALLGKGSCFSVYRIESHPRLVFRHYGYPVNKTHRAFLSQPVVPVSEPIDMHINYGQAVAYFGNKDTINLRVPGEVVAHLSSDNQIANYQKKLFMLASLPQKSYDDFCDDIIYLTRKRMGIDAVEMNTFIDEKSQKFYLVDVEPFSGSDHQKFDNGLSGMLAVCILAHKHHLINDLTPEEKYKAKLATKAILKKVLRACKKKQLEFSDQQAAQDNVDYISDALRKLLFSQNERKEVIETTVSASIYKNQILGHINTQYERQF